jgi:hypothetical protein
MEKYKNGSGGRDYNKCDFKFAFWTCYWNDKAKLGLNTEGCVNMANWMKGIAYLETHVNSNEKGDGIMQVEYATLDTVAGKGYFSSKFLESNREKKGGNWVCDLGDPNAGIYAGIGVWVANLSAWQGPENDMFTGIQNLQSWIGNRTDKNGKVGAALVSDLRYIYACGSYGPGGNSGTNYNTNHQKVDQLLQKGERVMWSRAYGFAIRNLVRQGRSPYSYQNEGAPGDSESSSSLFLP